MAWGNGRRPNHSGNPNLRKPAVKRVKPKIVWKDPEKQYGMTRREKPARYQEPGALAKSLKTNLATGAPVITLVPLQAYEDRSYPFTPLRQTGYLEGPSIIKAGTLLIYAGIVRVTERIRSSGEKFDMEVPKHTFIVPSLGRCIIHDLATIKVA